MSRPTLFLCTASSQTSLDFFQKLLSLQAAILPLPTWTLPGDVEQLREAYLDHGWASAFSQLRLKPHEYGQLFSRGLELLQGEQTAAGVFVTYEQLQQRDLWDFIQEETRKGDFCVVDIHTNPCRLYLDQVPRFSLLTEEQQPADFLRQELAYRRKLAGVATDRLVVECPSDLQDLELTLHRCLRFLGSRQLPQLQPFLTWLSVSGRRNPWRRRYRSQDYLRLQAQLPRELHHCLPDLASVPKYASKAS